MDAFVYLTNSGFQSAKVCGLRENWEETMDSDVWFSSNSGKTWFVWPLAIHDIMIVWYPTAPLLPPQSLSPPPSSKQYIMLHNHHLNLYNHIYITVMFYHDHWCPSLKASRTVATGPPCNPSVEPPDCWPRYPVSAVPHPAFDVTPRHPRLKKWHVETTCWNVQKSGEYQGISGNILRQTIAGLSHSPGFVGTPWISSLRGWLRHCSQLFQKADGFLFRRQGHGRRWQLIHLAHMA